MSKKKKPKAPYRFPSKPSALLRLAVKDAKLLESRPDLYELDMSDFVVKAGKICKVCMAGAVMVCRRTEHVREELKYYSYVGPSSLPEEDEEILENIDYMRKGDFINFDLPKNLEGKVQGLIEKNFTEDKGRAPWHVYLKAADMLKKAGY